MIKVLYDNFDELDKIIGKSAADGHCAVVCPSFVVIVERQDFAVALFMEMAAEYAKIAREVTAIHGVEDWRKRSAIAYGAETSSVRFLYGVPDELFAAMIRPTPDKIEID